MSADKLLFHYCSTQTGLAILQSREFRLSALSAANDSLEGRILGRVFADLLTEVGLLPEVVDVVSVLVSTYPETTEGFAFCLSEKADLLSQWRAYGRDGAGVAIGFSSEQLITDFGPVNFGAQFYELKKVEYGEEELRKSLRPLAQKVGAEFADYGLFARLGAGVTRESAIMAFGEGSVTDKRLFDPIGKDAIRIVSHLLEVIGPLHFKIYDTKPEPFYEECEWRLLRFRHKVALPDIKYFADDKSIRPFIACLMADPAKNAIREVVLGPKHTSSVSWVRGLLDTVDLPHVLVRRSTIESYR